MYNIRTMTITDYDSVYALWLSTPGMRLNTTDDSREGVAQFLLRNPATCFVAEAEGEIIGVIVAGHDGRRGYIYHTAVRIDCRRQGVGKALVDAAVQALEKEGIHKVALVAFKRNETGNGFWESMGFTLRDDLNYRNKNIHKLDRIDT